MKIALIVAQSENGVIGRANKLPWYLPEDLKYFKRVTMGKPVIMGRKTYESIGRPLPGRLNIVLSRAADYGPPGVQVVASLAQALELAEAQALIDDVEEAMIIGGEQIYRQALPLADRLYVTQVQAPVEGDAFFPAIDPEFWQLQSCQDFAATGSNPYPYSLTMYERVQHVG